MKPKVLITGINGFLATKFVEKYKNVYEFYGIYHKSLNNVDLDAFSKTVSNQDIQQLSDNFDYVLHLASYIPYKGMDTRAEKFIDTNIQLTIDIVKRFSSARIVFASSVSVYGETRSRTIHETSSYHQPTLYGLSKLAGETVLRNHNNFAIIRFSSLYGKGMTASTFLPIIVKRAVENKEIVLFGTGERKQDYFHIEDAADICHHAMFHNESTTFLGAHGKSYSNVEIATIIRKYLPDTIITFVGEDKSSSAEYDSNWSQMQLNFFPKINMQIGIKELIDDIKRT